MMEMGMCEFGCMGRAEITDFGFIFMEEDKRKWKRKQHFL